MIRAVPRAVAKEIRDEILRLGVDLNAWREKAKPEAILARLSINRECPYYPRALDLVNAYLEAVAEVEDGRLF